MTDEEREELRKRWAMTHSGEGASPQEQAAQGSRAIGEFIGGNQVPDFSRFGPRRDLVPPTVVERGAAAATGAAGSPPAGG